MTGFDESMRLAPFPDPDSARLHGRIAQLRDEIEKLSARMTRSHVRTNVEDGARLGDGGPANKEGLQRDDPELRSRIAKIAARAAQVHERMGGRGTDAVRQAVTELEDEHRQAAQRRALRGTVAFERAETRARRGAGSEGGAARW